MKGGLGQESGGGLEGGFEEGLRGGRKKGSEEEEGREGREGWRPLTELFDEIPVRLKGL